MSDQNNPATPPAAAPDWDHHEDDVFCPLCEYNLRGLIEPRCPECGYRFEWPDLLDPRRRLHPYLFEHHPEKNFRSFWRTAIGGWRPRRFWSSLHPVQPSRPRRLIAYWLMAAGTIVLAFLAMLVAMTVMETRASVEDRLLDADYTGYINHRREQERDPAFTEDHSSFVEAILEAILDEVYLTGYLTGYLTNAWRILRSAELTPVYRAPLILVLVWPWLTLPCLLVFRWSMRRAKVRLVHVLRCVVYSSDILFWYGLLLLVATPVYMQAYMQALSKNLVVMTSGFYPSRLHDVEIAIGLLALCIATYRLSVAYRRYLCFDHPVATVFASQIILALVLLDLFLFPMAWL